MHDILKELSINISLVEA